MAAPDSTTPTSTSCARGPWTAMRQVRREMSSTVQSKPAQRATSSAATRSRLPALGTTRYSSSPTWYTMRSSMTPPEGETIIV